MRNLLRHMMCLGVFAVPVASFAGSIIQPAAATSSLGSYAAAYLPTYAIDQSGLSAAYVSGVTDFDAFTATTTTLLGANGFNIWYSAPGVFTGNFDFSLGATRVIESFALWTDPQRTAGQGVQNFTLLADDNAAFSSPTSLGSFTASLAPVGGEATNFAQIFTFAPTEAAYVRLEILSNHGGTCCTGISEAAFEEAAVVPAPPALSLLGTGCLALLGWLRRRAR